MENKVEDFLKKYEIKNENVIVGFSSGPDSTALALILSKFAKKYNLNLILAYFNHNWRIEEVKKEVQFTKDFASKINSVFYIKEAPLDCKKNEETARELRYAFFEECAKKFNSKVVMLAHNKNDNIETLIYRIIKGTSIKGLCAIPENRDLYFRPLLDISKEEIYHFLKKNNQSYLTDSSNFDIKYKRNLIREKILPLFGEINSNYINSIDNLIKNSIASRKIIDSLLNSKFKRLVKNNRIIRSKFLKTKSEIRYEILNKFLGEYLKNRDYKTIVKFDDFILNNDKSKCSINSSLFLIISNDEIYIQERKLKNGAEVMINDVGEYRFLDIVFKIEKFENKIEKFPNPSEKICYISSKEQSIFPLTLRNRKNGDIFSPFGLKKGKMKLKDYFINQKIPQDKKDKYILLCKDNEVLWILGEKISEKYKVKSNGCYKLSYYKKADYERY